MSFQEEYEKRLRRVCGVTDDSLDVYCSANAWTEYSGCDTCGGGTNFDITVSVFESRKIIASTTFTDLGDLIRALDAVEL